METEPEQRSIQTKQYKIRPLTRQRARQLYDYLIAYKTTHDGLSPGLQTISLELGYGSTNTVEYHLALLERAGCIKRTKYHHGIQLKGGQWLPPKHLPEFPDIILNSIYRYIVQYKRNNDGLSPPAVLIRHQSHTRSLSIWEVEQALDTLAQEDQIIKDEAGLRVVGAEWKMRS